jgi:hypothetical protein
MATNPSSTHTPASLDSIIARAARRSRVARWTRDYRGSVSVENGHVVARAHRGRHSAEVSEPIGDADPDTPLDAHPLAYETLREAVARIMDEVDRDLEVARPLVAVRALVNGQDLGAEVAARGMEPFDSFELGLISDCLGEAIQHLTGDPP